MTVPEDPYRVLGLDRGASLEEVRRAYRRLAKRFHPDSVGEAATARDGGAAREAATAREVAAAREAATARFIAIQAAYETLAQGHPGPRPAGGGGSPRRPTGRPAPGARPGGGARPAPGARPGPGERPANGPRPPGGGGGRGRGAEGGRGAGPGAGAAGGPGQADGGGQGSDARRRSGPAAGPGGDAEGASRRGEGRRPPRVRTARPGSTSYDDADPEGFEPGWRGATWYGESSGTYWTINPREFSDPRKHGPEYQARGRHRASPPEGPFGSPTPATEERSANREPAGGPAEDRQAAGGRVASRPPGSRRGSPGLLGRLTRFARGLRGVR